MAMQTVRYFFVVFIVLPKNAPCNYELLIPNESKMIKKNQIKSITKFKIKACFHKKRLKSKL